MSLESAALEICDLGTSSFRIGKGSWKDQRGRSDSWWIVLTESVKIYLMKTNKPSKIHVISDRKFTKVLYSLFYPWLPYRNWVYRSFRLVSPTVIPVIVQCIGTTGKRLKAILVITKRTIPLHMSGWSALQTGLMRSVGQNNKLLSKRNWECGIHNVDTVLLSSYLF